MIRKFTLAALLLLATSATWAQTSGDPTIMTINGKPVSRSEFEYSYNKNNADGVIDKKSVKDYVDLFINYKLKVQAALDARLDTLSSFKKEFAMYRDKQIRPAMITDADVEAEAKKIYKQTQLRVDTSGGLVKPAHILVLLRQKSTKEQEERAQQRIDSLYYVLQHGGDFAELAKKYSDDKGSARNGGELPWIEKGQTFPDFEKVAYSLKKGEMSRPFKSPVGWHIVVMKDKRNFFPYDSLRDNIIRFIDQRGIREQIIDQKLDTLAKEQHKTPDEVLAAKRNEMEAADSNLKYLIQEYHDGLLLYEISNREVWGKAAKDTLGMVQFFKKNKKLYKWDEPRFKGIAYHTRKAEDVAAVKASVKSLPFDQWADKLRKTFNNDSILRIRVEKGIFKKGDNALVDKQIFKKDTVAKPMKDFPFTGIYGKKIKAPETWEDVSGQVTADYQDALEKQWVEGLRRRYSVSVDESVLDTVNKH